MLNRQHCRSYFSAVIEVWPATYASQLFVICSTFYGISTSHVTTTTCSHKVTSNHVLFVNLCSCSYAAYYVLLVSKGSPLSLLVREGSLHSSGGKEVYGCNTFLTIQSTSVNLARWDRQNWLNYMASQIKQDAEKTPEHLADSFGSTVESRWYDSAWYILRDNTFSFLYTSFFFFLLTIVFR